MTKKEKILNFVKTHEKEILIGVGVVVCGGLLGGTIKHGRMSAKLPYKTVVRSNSKDYIQHLNGMVNWRAGEQFDGGYIGYGLTDINVKDRISELLGDGSEDYLYSMLIERIKKS